MQTLVRNELRERVVVRVDGGIRNGRDILVSAIQACALGQHAAEPKKLS
jgi:glutamate synthase domain-containing protein 2